MEEPYLYTTVMPHFFGQYLCKGNAAIHGGAVFSWYSELVLNEVSEIVGSSADSDGGGIIASIVTFTSREAYQITSKIQWTLIQLTMNIAVANLKV